MYIIKFPCQIHGDENYKLNVNTVKHVYSDHAYNELTLIAKRLGIPGKHSIFFLINFTLTAKLDITKSRL